MNIQWKEVTQKHSGSSLANDGVSTNPWFAVSLVLLGLIVGFLAPWMLGANA